MGGLEENAAENFDCLDEGNYDIYLLQAAARKAAPFAIISDLIYSSSEIVYDGKVGPESLVRDMERSRKTGLLVNFGGEHYVTVVNIGNDNGWVIVDSLGSRPAVSYTAKGVMSAITARGYEAAFSIAMP
jgi:hypothetical protein